MAKGTSGGKSAHGTPSSLTSLLVPNPAIPSPLQDPVIVRQLYHGNYGNDPASDRRRHNPTKRSAPPHAPVRRATRLLMGTVGTTTTPHIRNPVRFAIPNLVTLCIRRKLRREVLHALNRTNSGRGGRKHRNFWSNVKC